MLILRAVYSFGKADSKAVLYALKTNSSDENNIGSFTTLKYCNEKLAIVWVLMNHLIH